MGCCASAEFSYPSSPDVWVNDTDASHEAKAGYPEGKTVQYNGNLEGTRTVSARLSSPLAC
jgi:hypothetical protein